MSTWVYKRRERRRRERVARLALLALLLLAAAVGLGYLVGKDGSGSGVYVGTAGGVAGASTSSGDSQRPQKERPVKQQASASASTSERARLATRSGDDVLATQTLSKLGGHLVTARGVPVRQVVGNEEFWVGTSPTQRVLVHLQTRGNESRRQIRRGDRVNFVGAVARNAPGVAATWGIVESEGSALLQRQGAHIVVRGTRVRIAG
jgi:hypothetical protein